MQGSKDYQEKLFTNFRLSERVPKNNFYRQLREKLDLSSLRQITTKYYSTEGQKSIDPEVFFKLMLIGYLENINSDRKIIDQAQLRLDMLYFLGYNIDEPLPWHSTLSRTRQLFGEEVFLKLFRHVLSLCIEKGLVSGKTQAVDSAFIKANASMESMVDRQTLEKSRKYLDELKKNEDGGKPKLKHGERFVSPSDPDARASRKPGKMTALNHLGIISVDTENHVICGAAVDFADKGDCNTTAKIVGQTLENLQQTGSLSVEEVLADGGYSSGNSYRYLEENNITAYIPVRGGYKPEKERFKYNEKEDTYTCVHNKKLFYKEVKKNRTTLSKVYRSKAADCQDCPLKQVCCKKGESFAEIAHSADKPLFDKAYRLSKTPKGRRMKRLRTATVEPVWGTLLHFRRMKKVYTKGNALANKQLLMAAAAYNLKKFMGIKPAKVSAMAMKAIVIFTKNTLIKSILTDLNRFLQFWDLVLGNRNYKMQKWKLGYL